MAAIRISILSNRRLYGRKVVCPWAYSRPVVVLAPIILPVSFVVSIPDADMVSGVAPVINRVDFLLKKHLRG